MSFLCALSIRQCCHHRNRGCIEIHNCGSSERLGCTPLLSSKSQRNQSCIKQSHGC